MECVFCDSFVREITFLESDYFRCIYNKAPILPGHSMVITKKHVQSMLDLNDTQRCELMRLSARAAESITEIFDADSFNWTIQDRPPAGQTIPHFHLHIIPRLEDDLPNPGDWYPQLEKHYDQTNTASEDREKLTRNEMEQITLRIKKHIHQKYQRTFVS